MRPDVVAPGVGLATDDARSGRRDRARFATATGSSAAAAVVAGAAALVAQARPDLSPRELRSVLVGSASSVGEAVTRQGAGLIDPAAAAEAKLVVEPATLGFGRASGKAWATSRTITVRNVSRQALEIGFASVADQPSKIGFTAEPSHLNLGPGASAQVTLGITAAQVNVGASGVLLATANGAPAARVPWAVGKRPVGSAPLIGSVSLSNWEFEPSKSAPAVLAFRAGRADSGDGEIEPVGLLDVELWTPEGKKLGLIARLRDLLQAATRSALPAETRWARCSPPGCTFSGCARSRSTRRTARFRRPPRPSFA